MKKIFLILSVVCATILGVNKANAETRWGVVAATNISTLKFNQQIMQVDQVCNFSLGVTGELMIPGIGFGVDASLLYTQLGAKLHLGDYKVWASDGYSVHRSYQHYLEIPLNLKFKYTNLNGIENTIAPIAFAGPTFTIKMGNSDIQAIKYAGGEFSVHVGLGAELFRKIHVMGSYNWGLTYALKTKKLDDYSAKNRFWRVSVAYMF